MRVLLECVPNFSEGRDGRVLSELADAVRSVSGVKLLNHSADPDHNRSVLTFAGDPASVCAAALRAARVAVTRIDMRTHSGQHPRMGALDVLPLVPLEGLTMEDAADVSRSLGKALWDSLGIPCYLYEEAASAPHRRNLADVRRGGFEGLLNKTRTPGWEPDFGSVPHPTAGATAVGARFPLIAFNILLKTSDRAVAADIARHIRESSGGMPYVKALGLYLANEDRAQVSMNLTRYTVTPPLAVFTEVTRLAGERGTDVLRSELIGLIPRAALPENPENSLKLWGFQESFLLENQLDSF